MDHDMVCSAQEKRELGRKLFFDCEGDQEKKNEGLRLILEAHSAGDAEATFLVAYLLMERVLTAQVEDQTGYALELMRMSANDGCAQARVYLDRYCQRRYEDRFGELRRPDGGGPLVDLEGKPIKVCRQGVFTPVDAVLEYVDGRNVLTLSANVQFVYSGPVFDEDAFEQAVCRGLKAWQGEYEVFGGQQLSVRVELTGEERAFDNLVIMPMTDQVSDMVRSVVSAIGTKEKKTQTIDVLDNKRSFAAAGLRWSVRSRKIIYIQSKDGSFRDLEEIEHVAKHEFGHALGLGDLYPSSVDALPGVKKGTYPELDQYAIGDRSYDLVMCDHHGPVSNNDIEMVLLAFRDNRMQLYQPQKIGGKISEALGKGN